MTRSKDEESTWVFDFCLEREDGATISHRQCEELLDHIISWCEESGLQIGGGFRAPRPEDMQLRPARSP